MMTRKLLIIGIITLICLTPLNGCSRGSVKVGFAGCLSGTNSELGVSGMYGALLAIEEINKAGGIKGQTLELVTMDDQGDKETALQVDKELVKQGCIAIIGHMTSDMADLTIPYINENQVLMISPTIALPTLSTKDDYFFRLIPSTKYQAERIAQEIIDQEIRKVQIVFANQNVVFANSIYESLVNNLDGSQVQTEMVGLISIKKDSTDFDKSISAITKSDADALVIVASADIVTEIAQSLYQAECHRTVFLPAWAMTNDLLKRGGPSVEGYYGVNFVDFDCQSEEYQKFHKEYTQKYGSEPTFASILSYESVIVLSRTMEQCSKYTADQLKTSILNIRSFQGLQNTLMFDRFGDIDRDTYMYQIENLKFSKAE